MTDDKRRGILREGVSDEAKAVLQASSASPACYASDARRSIGKWLNEGTGVPPRRDFAELCASYDMMLRMLNKCAEVMECNDPGNYYNIFEA